MRTMMAALAFLILCAFLGILLWFVPRLDLAMVIGATLLLTGFDLFVHKNRSE